MFNLEIKYTQLANKTILNGVKIFPLIAHIL